MQWNLGTTRSSFPLFFYYLLADFYCHEKKLVVELDGGIHDEKQIAEYDKYRTFELEGSGIKVIRFRNEEVEKNILSVLGKIKVAAEK